MGFIFPISYFNPQQLNAELQLHFRTSPWAHQHQCQLECGRFPLAGDEEPLQDWTLAQCWALLSAPGAQGVFLYVEQRICTSWVSLQARGIQAPLKTQAAVVGSERLPCSAGTWPSFFTKAWQVIVSLGRDGQGCLKWWVGRVDKKVVAEPEKCQSCRPRSLPGLPSVGSANPIQ